MTTLLIEWNWGRLSKNHKQINADDLPVSKSSWILAEIMKKNSGGGQISEKIEGGNRSNTTFFLALGK